MGRVDVDPAFFVPAAGPGRRLIDTASG